MKNIKQLHLEKYNNLSKYKHTNYQHIEGGIYQDLIDSDSTSYRIAVSFELEVGEDIQYPLDDILVDYSLYISDFLESESLVNGEIKLELGGELKDVQKIKEILGKHVFNREYIENGEIYRELIVE